MKISSFSKIEVKTSGPREAGKLNTTVQVGETKVAEVARRLGIPAEALVRANPQIKDQNALKAGQDIRLPVDLPHPPPPAPRPPQDSATSTSSKVGDPLAKSMAQTRLNQRESKTLELEPLSVVIEPRHTEFSDAYDHFFGRDAGKTDGSGKTGATEESPNEQAQPSEQEKQVLDFLETLHAAAQGDAAALAKVRSLPNVGLLDLEKILESLGFDWETLKTLVPDRVDKTADLTRDALSGNENAWVELQKEWTGHEPTAQQRKDHATNPFGNWFTAERSFQLWGLPTRPQEHLDRGKALQDALVKARNGDLSGLTKLGVDKNNVTPDQLNGSRVDQIVSLLSPDGTPASPEVMIPGVGPVGNKPGAGSSTGITPLINEAENSVKKALKLDPAVLAKLGLDPQFLRDLLVLFEGWKPRGGTDGRTPNNGAHAGSSSAASNPASTTTGGYGSANERLGFAETRRDDSGAFVGTGHDTSGSGGAASGGAAAREGSGAAESGAEKPATPSPKETFIIYSKKGDDQEVLGHRTVYSDGSVRVNWSNGTTATYKTEKEYEERDRSTDPGTTSSEGNTTVTVEPPESEKKSESDSGYRDNDASGYNNMTGSYATLRLSGDPLPPNEAPSDVLEEPRIDAGTTPNVDPDNLESSATMTRATAPIDFHRDGSIQGPPPNPNDPSTQERL